jgi:hypothetical protein
VLWKASLCLLGAAGSPICSYAGSFECAVDAKMPRSGLYVVSLQIYRNFEIGKLIKLIMLDTRVIGEHVYSGHCDQTARTRVRSVVSTGSNMHVYCCQSHDP